MKRLTIFLLTLLILCPVLCSAAAETLGWGFVNDTDVALRRGIGGKILTRLPKDTCVWINDTRTDTKGVLWYEITTGLHIDHANYDYSGWMKAEFIDAGADVWYDIRSLGAFKNGLIVLRSDGSTETAGRPIVAMDGSAWVSPKGWADPFGRVIAVGVPMAGNEYYIVTERNEFISSVNGRRLEDGMDRMALKGNNLPIPGTADFPDWKDDPEFASFRYGYLYNEQNFLIDEVSIGIRADGSLRVEPASMAYLFDGWADIADVKIAAHYVLGLKKDGTVLFSSTISTVPIDVSHWQDITAIGAGEDWCVGLKTDGTLVFSGDHLFMNEGHTRK